METIIAHMFYLVKSCLAQNQGGRKVRRGLEAFDQNNTLSLQPICPSFLPGVRDGREYAILG